MLILHLINFKKITVHKMTKKERFEYILNYFAANQPDVKSELKYNSPFELTVAVILSAQCTDMSVPEIS